MNQETILKIRNNPLIYHYLQENSYQYKYLYREDTYLKTIEALAKEYYKERPIDKIERLQNKISLIQAFMDVMN